MLWLDLSKARRGERVGGKYIRRWWNAERNSWDYAYSKTKSPRHGVAHTASSEHTVDVHPATASRLAPKEAFHSVRKQALKPGRPKQTAVYHDAQGTPLFKVTIKPGGAFPIRVSSHDDEDTSSADRKQTFSALENWHRRQTTVQTVRDAHGRPWFDVRERGGESQSGRLSVRYYKDSAYNPYPNEPSKWVPSPVYAKDLLTWIKKQRKEQRLSSDGGKIKPKKTMPRDEQRPVTTSLEQGEVRWQSKQVPIAGKRGRRWVRQAVLGGTERKRSVYGNIMGENFGLMVMLAARQLRSRSKMNPENMARLLGFVGGTQLKQQKIAVDPTSPVFLGIERAVNSYDPAKGWRFNTWLGQCLNWEYLKEVKKIIEDDKRSRREVVSSPHAERVHDVIDTLDVDLHAAPGHELVVGTGKHRADAQVQLARQQEVVNDWKGRQESRLANAVGDSDSAEFQATAIRAFQELEKVRDGRAAQDWVVKWQSEGGDAFVEPVEKEPTTKQFLSLTEAEKQDWISFVKDNPSLSEKQRLALLAIAPSGDLSRMRQFPEVATELHKKHPVHFPVEPTVGQLVNMFLSAHQALSGTPEFEAMQQKLSPVEKAILLLRGLGSSSMRSALDILSKAKKGGRGRDFKYWRREGHPGNYKYFYRESGSGNIARATNAPEGHEHHVPEDGSPQLHKDEPDPDQHPQFFDRRNGRKMNRSVPDEAEWNDQYNSDRSLSLWAARWRHPEHGHYEHAYYDSDLRMRTELKYNIDNRHFDEQLPKVRGFYKEMMHSQQLPNRALGLMIALLDQAQMRVGRKVHEQQRGTLGLTSIKLANVKLKGNTATFSYTGKKGVRQDKTVALDDVGMQIMKELVKAPGKKPKDYLFSVPVKKGSRTVYREIGYNKLRRNLAVLGVTPKQFRTYHGTEIFSKTFQHMISRVKGRVTSEILDKVTEESALASARALGHYLGKGDDRKEYTVTTLRSYIDPMVVRSLYINAMNPESSQNVEKGFKLQGRTEFQGLPVSVENKRGSVRKWYDPHEKKEGSTKMLHCYGYIRGTKGTDGDHVDVYLGPNKDAQTAFVVHQMKAPDFKKFDEDKVMLGFDSEKEAREAYIKQYDSPKFYGGMTAMSMDEFKRKVEDKSKQGRMLKSYVGGEYGKKIPRIGRYRHMDHGQLYHLLKNGHFSIVSAGRNPAHPDEKDLPEDHQKFADRHESLRKDLEHHGFDHTEVEGKYGSRERSFIVHHHPDKKPQIGKSFLVHHEHPSEHATVRDLGKKYNQDSVIHSKQGKHELHYVTGQNEGTHHKGDGHEVKPHASDFYTKVEHADHPPTKFSLNFNWDHHHEMGEALHKAVDPDEMPDHKFSSDDSGESAPVDGGQSIVENDDDQHLTHSVSSSPPARFPHEQEFSYWLHTHPIHESEHEWQGLKQLGVSDLHHPQDDEDETHDEESEPSDSGPESAEPAGEPDAEEPEQQPDPNDFSHLDTWGGRVANGSQ